MQLSYEKHTLEFKKPAVTSRGSYNSKVSWIVKLSEGNITGIGEASPLPDLSTDGQADLESVLKGCQELMEEGGDLQETLFLISQYPSLLFALECAWLDLQNGGNKILFQTAFTKSETGIPINGLVWMSDIDEMYVQAKQKLEDGFRCIKFKVGAHDHDAECRLLEKLRKEYSAFKLEIRLDANGAYAPDLAPSILKDWARFEIHSIEQPIKAGNWDLMAEVVAKSAVKIALDEELIGVQKSDFSKLLNTIKPAYLILKPTLLGGFKICDAWIENSHKNSVGWWATSALESNVGLGHIAQWVSTKNTQMAQGLGTGALFTNNFNSQVYLNKDVMWFGNKNTQQ